MLSDKALLFQLQNIIIVEQGISVYFQLGVVLTNEMIRVQITQVPNYVSPQVKRVLTS